MIDVADYYLHSPFMSNDARGIPDGNTLLYTGTHIVILNNLNQLKKEDCMRFVDSVKQSWKEPGLLNRGWGRTDPQSHDDYIGVMAAAHICAADIAYSIAEYGIKNGWNFNNKGIERTVQSWFWRIPGVVQHMKVAAFFKLNVLDQLLMSLDLIYTTFRPADEVSGRILDWLKIKTFEGKGYFLMDLAAWFWKKDIKKKYPGLMGEVFSKYFSPEHPFAIYMKDKI